LGKERITITTFGNGHGVGLSQWGAHGMALKGMKAQQILKYYYRGVKVANLNDVWPKWR
jgi:stage II sporulation protein D